MILNIEMKEINKLLFISFQSLNGTKLTGMTKFVIPIINKMPTDIKSKIIYYVSSVQNSKESFRIKNVSFFYLLFTKVFLTLNRYFIKLPSYKIRYIQEKMFDYIFSLKITNPITIISTAYLPKTQKKNKALGGINIFFAGNPDDFEINAILKNEKKKHEVFFEDAYTYDKRIEFVSKSLFSYDHILTITVSEKESYSKRIPKERISFIENHIIPSASSFPPLVFAKEEKITFCFVAHPFWLKGLPYLLEAWSKIDNSEIKLRIAGNIDKHLQKVIDDKYSDLSNVEYLGWVKDLNEFLRNSHVCIVPSLLDAGPTTVAEAMFCGMPVIVSDGCGAWTLIKDGINGFIVPSGNSEAIAERINWFVSNQDKIAQMGKEAIKSIEDLAKSDQNKKVAEHILQVIKELQ